MSQTTAKVATLTMHHKTLKRISALVMGIAALLLSLKIMTAVVLFSDDPTTLLVVKSSLSWSNLMQDAQPSQYWLVLVSDENGFVGLTLYQLLVDYAGPVTLALVLLSAILGLSSWRTLMIKSG